MLLRWTRKARCFKWPSESLFDQRSEVKQWKTCWFNQHNEVVNLWKAWWFYKLDVHIPWENQWPGQVEIRDDHLRASLTRGQRWSSEKHAGLTNLMNSEHLPWEPLLPEVQGKLVKSADLTNLNDYLLWMSPWQLTTDQWSKVFYWSMLLVQLT